MQSRIQKWGNSLGLRIPVQLAKQFHLQPGSSVTIKVENNRMIIEPPKYDLDTMLKGITAKNLHHLMLEDEPRGNEEW